MSLNWRDWPVPHHSSAELLAELAESFEYYDDDILVTTYPKCGTTLVQEVASCLVLGPEKTRTTDLKLRSPFLDLNPPPGLPRPIDAAGRLGRPRVMKTHLPAAFHIRHLMSDGGLQSEQAATPASNGPRNIIVMRNPKDAIVSAYYHMTGGMRPLPGVPDKFSQFWRQVLLGCGGSDQPAPVVVHDFFDFSLSWWSLRGHPRVLILFYEDLISAKAAQVKRLAKFLDVTLTDDLLQSVLDQTSFATMRANPNVNIALSEPESWRPGASFIRRGEVGDWKRHFTVADSEVVDRLTAERLAGSELSFRYELGSD